MNPCQPETLPRNNIQNLKKDGNRITVTTRGGKHTIDPPRPSMVESVVEKYDDEIVVIGESKNAIEKEI